MTLNIGDLCVVDYDDIDDPGLHNSITVRDVFNAIKGNINIPVTVRTKVINGVHGPMVGVTFDGYEFNDGRDWWYITSKYLRPRTLTKSSISRQLIQMYGD